MNVIKYVPPHLVGSGAQECRAIRNDVENAFSSIELGVRRDSELWVDIDHGSDVTGDGSTTAPFASIQAALDALELIPFNGGSSENYAVCVIPPSASSTVTISSTLVYAGRKGLYLKFIGPRAYLSCIGGPVLVVSNATRASIAAFLVSRTWADLVNSGYAGATRLQIDNVQMMNSLTPSGNHNCLELIGVVGDDTPTTTGFLLTTILNEQVFLNYKGTAYGLWARNCGSIHLMPKFSGIRVKTEGCSKVYVEGEIGDLEIYKDPADVNGNHKYGYIGTELRNVHVNDDLTLDIVHGTVPVIDIMGTNIVNAFTARGNAKINILESSVGREDADAASVTETVQLESKGTTWAGNLTLGDGVVANIRSGVVVGALTVSAGAGAVTLNSCPVQGAITDASSRLTITQSLGTEAKGTVVAGGAGDQVVNLSPAFPSAVYKIQLTVEGALQTAYVKTGKTASSFTIVTGGACSVHWEAKL